MGTLYSGECREKGYITSEGRSPVQSLLPIKYFKITFFLFCFVLHIEELSEAVTFSYLKKKIQLNTVV